MRDALIQIVLRLRDDVIKGREGNHNPSAGADSSHAGGTGFSLAPVLPNVPPAAPLSYDHRIESGNGVGMRSSGSRYGQESLSVYFCFPCMAQSSISMLLCIWAFQTQFLIKVAALQTASYVNCFFLLFFCL